MSTFPYAGSYLGINEYPAWLRIRLRVSPADVIEGGIRQHQQVDVRIRINLQDGLDKRLSRGLAAPGRKVEDSFAHQPRSFLLIGSVIEHPGCSQSRSCFDNGVKDAQLQSNPISPQF